MIHAPAIDASVPCVVLGAGLAGLSFAYHLRAPAILLEACGEVGGTARSFARDGFTFDVTGHWLHLRHASMRSLVHTLAPELFVKTERQAEIYAFATRTPYPFQAHTHGLPAQVVADCLLGYFAAREAMAKGPAPAHSFADYVYQCMGAGIAEHFMLPYNRKLWTVDPSEMAHAWCGRFVPLPTPEEVVWGALSPKGCGRALGYNSAFLYPRTGGIGQLAQALAKAQNKPLHLCCRAHAIDVVRKQVKSADGRVFAYKKLVSTLPLPQLIAAIARAAQVPEAVLAATAKLRATQLTYWDIGFAKAAKAGAAHWTYYPDPALPFFRVGSPSAVRKSLAPNGGRSYYVEVAHPQGSPCPVSDAEVLQGLVQVGLVDADEVPVVWSRNNLPCAYVIMDHAYGPARAQVLQWLGTRDIYPVGRFGAWTYDSMEGALRAGQRAAQEVDAALEAGDGTLGMLAPRGRPGPRSYS